VPKLNGYVFAGCKPILFYSLLYRFFVAARFVFLYKFHLFCREKQIDCKNRAKMLSTVYPVMYRCCLWGFRCVQAVGYEKMLVGFARKLFSITVFFQWRVCFFEKIL
jgi:hypothetical protein